MKIKSFNVIGLHGQFNYEIKFDDNKLILVAENGSGKTTLVNLFYYFLSRQWSKLNEYEFDRVILIANNKEFKFEKKNYREIYLRDSKLNKRFPTRYISATEHILKNYSISDLRRQPALVEHLSNRFDVPVTWIHEIFHLYRRDEDRIEKEGEVEKLDAELAAELHDVQIVYLPTYRRIEKDLKNIFPHLEQSMREYEFKRENKNFSNDNYIELVEFGMEDVKSRVEKRCTELRATFYKNLGSKITGAYLEDILNKRYKNFEPSVIKNFSEEALKYILNRLDESIISTSGKQELEKFVEIVKNKPIESLTDEDKINAYFVWKLFQIYEEQQKAELDINQFVNICNDYIGGRKYFEYDNYNFKVDIYLSDYKFGHQFRLADAYDGGDDERPKIDYRDLSSGEKQIVSLFSHLILSKKDYFIIIDEPELSLSVPWQERFLIDVTFSSKFGGLLAVTHSPFIFKNTLKTFAHSLDEFSK